jgi:elongation factor 1-beta
MGQGSVVTTFKIMPEGVEVNLDKLEEDIKNKINPSKIERIPIAFGLNAIITIKVIEEKEGELDRVTEELKSIPGVREVEVTNVARSW